MTTRADIYQAIRNADAAGDSASVQKLAAYLQTMPPDPVTPRPPSPQHDAIAARVNGDAISQDAQSGPSFLGELAGQVGNLIGGATRGAGSIGATIMYPVDKAQDLYYGDRGPNITGLVTGQQPISRNQERRQDMDSALRTVGVDTESPAFKVGKVGAEIAGTAGTGGLLANGAVRVAPVVAEVAPNLVNAVRTGGMVAAPAGSTVSPVVNTLTRVAGGAINGGASSAIVDPSRAGTGAALGAGLPVATKLAGAAGNALGKLVSGPTQTPEMAAAVDAARKAGYVIPPSQANPNLLNRVLEGVAGKVSTAQSASARNAATTNSLAAQALGLPADTVITPEVLDAVRKQAGTAYGDVAGMGTFDAAGARLPAAANVQRGYDNLTLAPKATVDARDVVNAWKQANADANSLYTAYGRDAMPETLAKAKAAEADANALNDFLTRSVGQREGQSLDDLTGALALGRISPEDFIARALGNQMVQSGAKQGAKQALDAARTQIAKSYSVENALNPETGTVNALKLAAQQAKGKPLSGGLDTAASFAARFPKAAQTPEKMGSLPGTSPLDIMTSAITPDKLLSMLTLGIRPAARSLALSPMVQNRLVQSGGVNPLAALLANDPSLALAYRLAPDAAADR